ncbi:MAG: hypothetical protein ISS56_05640 [Anaerolineae bacterium]|nr:hypothetical protein [Anaerolineae bacterium]
MRTELQIDGDRFLINGTPTYQGVTYRDKPIEGLLFNSRMVQAIFDDENPETAVHWRYPDTGEWDPDRNTDEFCAILPEYRRHGLLAVTVGLQGGGSIYEPQVYDHYLNSAFAPDGALKPAYCERLARVLDAADRVGMVVIVNYFYWKQLARMDGDGAVLRATEGATDWLLRTGHRNIVVDVMNEFGEGEGLLRSGGIHRLIEIAQQTTLDGRRLLASSSVHPKNLLPDGRWQEVQDVYMPHGNDFWADELRVQLQRIKASDAYRRHPRPILINEDSIYLDSMRAAVDEYASWGFYSQGYGCGGWHHGRFDWLARGREARCEDLSGYQTVPVNWGINTDVKRAFFDLVAEVTGAPDHRPVQEGGVGE